MLRRLATAVLDRLFPEWEGGAGISFYRFVCERCGEHVLETDPGPVCSCDFLLKERQEEPIGSTPEDRWEQYMSLYKKVHGAKGGWTTFRLAEDRLTLSILDGEGEEEALEAFREAVCSLYKRRILLHNLIRRFSKAGISLSHGIVEEWSEDGHPIRGLRRRVLAEGKAV